MYQLKTDLCFSDNTIRGNGEAYKVFTVPMKDVKNIDINTSSNWLTYKIFWNKEIWEREHVIDTIRHTRHILDTDYGKSDPRKVS